MHIRKLSVTTKCHPLTNQIKDLWRTIIPENSVTAGLFEDVTLVITYLKQQDRSIFWTRSVYVGALLHSLIHQRCSYTPDPTHSPRSHYIDRCARLAIGLALADVRRTLGIIPVSVVRCSQELRTLLEQHPEDWERLGLVKLWILMAAVVEESNALSRAWFVSTAKKELDKVGPARRREVVDGLVDMHWKSDFLADLLGGLRTST